MFIGNGCLYGGVVLPCPACRTAKNIRDFFRLCSNCFNILISIHSTINGYQINLHCCVWCTKYLIIIGPILKKHTFICLFTLFRYILDTYILLHTLNSIQCAHSFMHSSCHPTDILYKIVCSSVKYNIFTFFCFSISILLLEFFFFFIYC